MKKATTILALCLITFTAFGCSKKEHSTHDMSKMTPSETAAMTTDSMPTQDQVLAAQTTCPIMGGAIDSTLFVEQDGKRIYVCCSGCIEAVKKDFAAAEKKIYENNQKPESVE